MCLRQRSGKGYRTHEPYGSAFNAIGQFCFDKICIFVLCDCICCEYACGLMFRFFVEVCLLFVLWPEFWDNTL